MYDRMASRVSRAKSRNVLRSSPIHPSMHVDSTQAQRRISPLSLTFPSVRPQPTAREVASTFNIYLRTPHEVCVCSCGVGRTRGRALAKRSRNVDWSRAGRRRHMYTQQQMPSEAIGHQHVTPVADTRTLSGEQCARALLCEVRPLLS